MGSQRNGHNLVTKQQYVVTKLGSYLINIMLFDLKLYCEVVFVLTRYLHESWEEQSIPFSFILLEGNKVMLLVEMQS